MTPEEKARELKSQFGNNAKYVCLEIINEYKVYGSDAPEAELRIIYYRKVKQIIETK